MARTLALLLLVACGGGGTIPAADTDTTAATNPTTDPNTDPSTATGACEDPGYNPLAGTCVETFLAACFDPSGACTGEADAMGNVSLTWENGATVVTTTDLSNPMDPVITTELAASDGETCAIGVTEINVGGCASRTTYQRPDGATQSWCIAIDGSYAVTCDDGTTVEIDAAEAAAVSECQYGGTEPCDVQTPSP